MLRDLLTLLSRRQITNKHYELIIMLVVSVAVHVRVKCDYGYVHARVGVTEGHP